MYLQCVYVWLYEAISHAPYVLRSGTVKGECVCVCVMCQTLCLLGCEVDDQLTPLPAFYTHKTHTHTEIMEANAGEGRSSLFTHAGSHEQYAGTLKRSGCLMPA